MGASGSDRYIYMLIVIIGRTIVVFTLSLHLSSWAPKIVQLCGGVEYFSFSGLEIDEFRFSHFFIRERKMKLFFITAAATANAASVSNSLLLQSPPQIDCATDRIADYSWECNLIGKVGHQQKVCTGRCGNGSKSGLQKCSCLKKLGPIEFAVPCHWVIEDEPVCELRKVFEP